MIHPLGPHPTCSRWFVTPIAALILAAVFSSAQSQPPAGEVSLYGTVRDSEDKPVAGATVFLQAEGGAGQQSTTTDAQGKYSFKVVPGKTYSVRATAHGYLEVKIPSYSVATAANPLDLTLNLLASAPQFFDQPQFTISGVTDTTGYGGHGSDTMMRARQSLASETANLAKTQPIPAKTPESLEKSLRAAVHDQPQSFESNHQMGRVLLEQGKPREAIPYLEQAAKLKPNDYANAFDLALASSDAGDLASARDQAQELLATHDTAELHHLLAGVQEEMGDSLGAVRQYQRAAELDPNEPNLFDWGSELLLHHAAEPALQIFTKGNHLFPRSIRMLIGVGAAEFAAGSDDLAVKQFCAASDLNPDDPVPYRFLGKTLQAPSTQSGELVDRLHRYARLYPDSAEANYLYAVALWRQKRDAETAARVQSLLNHALSLDPHFSNAYLERGIVQADQQDLPPAISDFQHAIQISPELEEAHYRLARAYRAVGQTDKAAAEVQIYQKLSEQSAEKVERERHEIPQFVYTLRDQPPHQNP